MGKILAFAGNKQSGKNTCSNYLHGFQLKCFNAISNFYILQDGSLIIEGGDAQKGILDVTRKDHEFSEWASNEMWPLVKNYAFADDLKEIGITLFNIPREIAYGTDEQKKMKLEHLRWENMPGVTTHLTPQDPIDSVVAGRLGFYYEKVLSGVIYHEPGPMSTREWLQFFGTEVCRKMYDNVWCERTINKIKAEDSQLAIVSDCRFINECDAIKAAGGKIIHLTRKVEDTDSHASENSLLFYEWFDTVIDNQNMTVEETCHAVLDALDSWGWMG
jgi:hypothetical protein